MTFETKENLELFVKQVYNSDIGSNILPSCTKVIFTIIDAMDDKSFVLSYLGFASTALSPDLIYPVDITCVLFRDRFTPYISKEIRINNIELLNECLCSPSLGALRLLNDI